MKAVYWEREGCMEGEREHDRRGSTETHLAMGPYNDVLEYIIYD